MSLDPDDWGCTNEIIFEWRQYLKRQLLIQRRYRSDLSGELLTEGCHLHEGIVTRGNVPKSIVWHYKIYSPYNCFLLSPEEHIPQPPSWEWCVEKAYARYGRENVRNWFYHLPWKHVPFELP